MNKQRVLIKFFQTVLLFLSSFAFSEKVNFFTKKPAYICTNGISFENGTDFAPLTQSVDFYGEMDFTELDLSLGAKFHPDSYDITTKAVYWPTLFNHFNAGIGSILHFTETYDIYSEIDFLSGLFFKYHTNKLFDISFNMLVFEKASHIYAIDDSIYWLTNNNMALGLETNFYISKIWRLYFDFSSYSYYRYMLFFAPDFKLGVIYNLSKNFALGTEFEAQYIDMFTLSANFNSATFRSYIQMELK